MKSIASLFLLIFFLAVIINFVSNLSENRVVANIQSEDDINPPPKDDWVSIRQFEFTDEIKSEILSAASQLKIIRDMPSGSSGEKERKRQAKNIFYNTRKVAWASATTPLYFDRFTGIVEEIKSDRILGGPNSGATKLTLKVILYGSGIVLQDQMLLDNQNNPIKSSRTTIWNINNKYGAHLNWFDIPEDSPVSVSGSFIRYTDQTKWAHCCVASTEFPKFSVDFKSVTLLTE